MGIMTGTMTEQNNIDTTIQEDFIKILGYIASISFLLVVIFSMVYILFPESASNFQGIELDIPYINEINGILTYALNSVSNIFTYIFLVVVGIVSFVGAQYLEDQLPGEEIEPEDIILKPVHEMEEVEKEAVQQEKEKELPPHHHHIESKEELLFRFAMAKKRIKPSRKKTVAKTQASVKETQPAKALMADKAAAPVKASQHAKPNKPTAAKSVKVKQEQFKEANDAALFKEIKKDVKPAEQAKPREIPFSRKIKEVSLKEEKPVTTPLAPKKKEGVKLKTDAFIAEVLGKNGSKKSEDEIPAINPDVKKEAPLSTKLENFGA